MSAKRPAPIGIVVCHGGALSVERSRIILGLRPEPSLLPPPGGRILIRDAAEILGCSCHIVRRLLNDGMLRGQRFTVRGIRVTRESLLAFIRWFEAIEVEDDRLNSRCNRSSRPR